MVRGQLNNLPNSAPKPTEVIYSTKTLAHRKVLGARPMARSSMILPKKPDEEIHHVKTLAHRKVAEREGFEPSVGFWPTHT